MSASRIKLRPRFLLGLAALAYASIGLALRLGPRDSGGRWLAPAFYGAPWLCIVAALLAASLYLARARRWLLLAAAGAAAFWLKQDYRLPPYPLAATSQEPIRLLFWNLNRPQAHPKTSLLELIAEQQANVVALVETEGIKQSELEAYRKALPGWNCLSLPRGMGCFAKATMKWEGLREIGPGSFANHLRLEGPGGPWHLWIADLYASPTRDRFLPLSTLRTAAMETTGTVVTADFNTPADSAAFDTWRGPLQNAWEVAGSGFRQTWPYGAPVLSLDQAWADSAWDIRAFHQGYRRLRGSDHAWFLLELGRR